MGRAQIKKSIIVAFSNDRTIGREGEMPWKLAADLKRFQAITTDKPVIMGRKTYESLGKPLARRTNIVVTRQADLAVPEGVIICASLADAYEAALDRAHADGMGEICIIGGGEIYAEAIKDADYIYATHVVADIPGDTKFPELDPKVWEAFVSYPGPSKDSNNSHPTLYVSYQKR